MISFCTKISLLTFLLQSDIKQWHTFLLREIQAKRIHPGVIKPVQHYLSHIVYMIKQQGLLTSYSVRSMERSIGKYKRLIRSKVNAGNILERSTIRNHINNQSWDVETEIELLTHRKYGNATFKTIL
jgi:hypothetical protein